jgi:hypothetical protein
VAVNVPAPINGALVAESALVVPYGGRLDDVAAPASVFSYLVVIRLAHYLAKDGLRL